MKIHLKTNQTILLKKMIPVSRKCPIHNKNGLIDIIRMCIGNDKFVKSALELDLAMIPNLVIFYTFIVYVVLSLFGF